MKERLKELILQYAFQFSETPVFKLAHGGTSQFYFNCKRVSLDPEGQYLIGNLLFDAIGDPTVQAVGGLTLGADPMACAVAHESWLRGHPIQAFVVRKREKDHGIVKLIEGKVKPGDRVVVVDDVVTTGGSTLQAISACKQAGLEVVKALVLVDRQEMNGKESILREVPEVQSLVTRDEIMELYRKKRGAQLSREVDMGESMEQSSNVSGKKAKDEKGRSNKANDVYCQTCEENGIKVSAWEDFPAWLEFVEGRISESQFVEQAKTEMEQFSKTFGKYVVIEKEDTRQAQEEEEKRKRAKRANKIYRMVCSETGIMVCFFHDFNSWSQYVEGKISEEEFMNRVKKEIQEIAAKNN